MQKVFIDIMSPIIIALLLIYILNPIIKFMTDKWKVNRLAGIIVAYIFLFMLIYLFFVRIAPRLLINTTELAEDVPKYFEKYNVIVNEFIMRYEYSILPDSVKDAISNGIENMQIHFVDGLSQFVIKLLGFLHGMLNLLLGGVIAFYALMDIEKIKIPDKFESLIREINGVLVGFIWGQTILSVILTGAVWLTLSLFGVQYALLLSILTGILNFIPYFGGIVAIVPVLIVSIFSIGYDTIWVMTAIVFLQQIEANILSPKIVGSKVGLHPITVIIAVIVGGRIFGFIGLILAVPAAAIAKIFLRRTSFNFLHHGR